jgi:uncharacterized protein DUF5658
LRIALTLAVVSVLSLSSHAFAAETTPVTIAGTSTESVAPAPIDLAVAIDNTRETAIAPASQPVPSDAASAPAAELTATAVSTQRPVILPNITHGPRSVTIQKRTVLFPMFASLAALQAYDAYSTITGLNRGLVEANPMMQGVTGNAMALVGVKAGTAALSIYAANRLWTQHHRTAAVALIAASNVLSSFVAVHNAAAIGSVR